MERDEIFQDESSSRSPLALSQGTLLNGQFRVGRVLGVGGFGITYLAFDEVLEIVVAVKEFLPNSIAVRTTGSDTVQPLSSTGEKQDFEFGLERFLHEARTLAKFEDHPNIVRVRTFFEENGTGYLVMNFYEGRTLSEYLAARNGFLPEEEALLITEQVVDGLSAVHEQNILHRDIDPNNVYLADNGTVVLLDFGAARTAVGERTHSMSVVLKRGYAPHEQYHSYGDQGPWTDVYACAATLYRTLTGYKPPEAAARIWEDNLAAPNELVPSLSERTNEAVMRGLAVLPEDRPQTIEEFATLLPDPPTDAEPGWVGELTTVETPITSEGASAELQISTTHPCRLYVDGAQTAVLEPPGRYTLGLEAGTHRLRAVRTDQAKSGNATVTDSGTSIEEGRHSRMSLDTLVWQHVVSVSAEEPTVVDIDFEEEPTEAAEATVQSPSTAPADRPDPDGRPGDTVPAGDTEVAEGPDFAPLSDDARVRLDVDRSARLFVDGDRVAVVGSNEDYSITVPPGSHQVRAEATDGTERWEQEVVVEAGALRHVQIGLDRTREPPSKRFGRPGFAYVGIGAGALVMLVVLGWWMYGDQRPQPQSDSVVTTAGEVTVDVVANDRGPEGAPLRIVSAGPLPDSVGRVAAVDSNHLRIQTASSFAGTAEVPYEVADPAGNTARSVVAVQVPFDGEQRTLTDEVSQPQVVRTDSLGDDGALDAVIAALGDRAVLWSKNSREVGNPFLAPSVVDRAVDGAVDVHTADLNGNGRTDILSASLQGDAVSWYENREDGSFGPTTSVTSEADGAIAVRAADVDRDGDSDVVVGALMDETVTWYENTGDGQFGDGTTIAEGISGLEALHIADLDANGAPEVLVVSYQNRVIFRYELQKGPSDSLRFVEQPAIGANLNTPIEVHTEDLMGNEEADVLVGKAGDESLLLFENRTSTANPSRFGNKRVLATSLETVEGIDTGDLDADGDQDVFAASFESNKVVWFENFGDGSFGEAQPIATNVQDVTSLDVADVDRDGDLDVIVASQAENVVTWYENHLQ